MARHVIAVAAFGFALVALAPLAALADQTPALNPSLQSILAPPPDSYTASVRSALQGSFRAADYAATWGSDNSVALNDLELDGFVSGYGLAKEDTASGRIVAEFVMAFTGQKGAVRFLASDKAENQASSHFKHLDPAAGMGQYFFGVHEEQASPALMLDAFEFVKGNNLFGVGMYAAKDDALLARAQVQARTQYDAAPAFTIPPSQWPDAQATPSSDQGLSLGSGPEVFVVLAAVAVLAAIGVFIWMRQGELKPEKPKVEQKMTADGQYWWNGTYWIASSEYAPPWAQRSRDGAFWWDGHAWQAVPRPATPAGR